MSKKPEAPRKTIESWREAKKTEAWLYNAAKFHGRWAIGQEVTEAEYDKVITETANLRIG